MADPHALTREEIEKWRAYLIATWQDGESEYPAQIDYLCDMALASAGRDEYERLRGLIERRISGMAMPAEPGPIQECAKCAHSELCDLLAAFDAGEPTPSLPSGEGRFDEKVMHRRNHADPNWEPRVHEQTNAAGQESGAGLPMSGNVPIADKMTETGSDPLTVPAAPSAPSAVEDHWPDLLRILKAAAKHDVLAKDSLAAIEFLARRLEEEKRLADYFSKGVTHWKKEGIAYQERAEELQKLVDKFYSHASGFCSAHREPNVDCETCFPHGKSEWMERAEAAEKRVRELEGKMMEILQTACDADEAPARELLSEIADMASKAIPAAPSVDAEGKEGE